MNPLNQVKAVDPQLADLVEIVQISPAIQADYETISKHVSGKTAAQLLPLVTIAPSVLRGLATLIDIRAAVLECRQNNYDAAMLQKWVAGLVGSALESMGGDGAKLADDFDSVFCPLPQCDDPVFCSRLNCAERQNEGVNWQVTSFAPLLGATTQPMPFKRLDTAIAACRDWSECSPDTVFMVEASDGETVALALNGRLFTQEGSQDE